MDIDRSLLSEELVQAVESLTEAFAARSVRHALIGGLAIAIRGRPRLTQDVDFLVDVPQIALPGLLDDLVERGFTLDPVVVIGEYVREHITAFSFGPVRIDWLKPVLPFYSRAIADASPMDWSQGHSIRVATAEGLILTKMVAFRPQDQADIDTLLVANRDTIDIDSSAGNGRRSRRRSRSARRGWRRRSTSGSCGGSDSGFFPLRTDFTSFGRSSRSRWQHAPTCLRVHLTFDMFFRKSLIPDRRKPAPSHNREEGAAPAVFLFTTDAFFIRNCCFLYSQLILIHNLLTRSLRHIRWIAGRLQSRVDVQSPSGVRLTSI